MRWEVGGLAWDCEGHISCEDQKHSRSNVRTVLVYTPDPWGRILSNTVGMPLCEHASEDRLGLPNTRNRRSVYISHDIIFIRTHPTCKIPCYNPDIRFASPSDVHTSTHLPQNNTHTSHTTNILAYAAGCIHARTHTRLLSYIAHVTNACTLWPNVLVLVGG